MALIVSLFLKLNFEPAIRDKNDAAKADIEHKQLVSTPHTAILIQSARKKNSSLIYV